MDFYSWQDRIRSENGPKGASVRLVLLTLVSWMNKRQTFCWPSQKLIGVRSDLERTSVNRNLKEAERQGWIVTSNCFPDASRAKGKVYSAAINGRPIMQLPPRGYSKSEHSPSHKLSDPVANRNTNTYRYSPSKYEKNSNDLASKITKGGFKKLLGHDSGQEEERSSSDQKKTKALMLAISMGAGEPREAIGFLGNSFDLADAKRLWNAAEALRNEMSQDAPIG